MTDEQKLMAWNNAQVVSNNDPKVWRKDACGAWIKWEQYGATINCGYGWEIDHITPKSKGGSDSSSNLRALQWENNRAKSDGRLVTKVTSKGTNNVYPS